MTALNTGSAGVQNAFLPAGTREMPPDAVAKLDQTPPDEVPKYQQGLVMARKFSEAQDRLRRLAFAVLALLLGSTLGYFAPPIVMSAVAVVAFLLLIMQFTMWELSRRKMQSVIEKMNDGIKIIDPTTRPKPIVITSDK